MTTRSRLHFQLMLRDLQHEVAQNYLCKGLSPINLEVLSDMVPGSLYAATNVDNTLSSFQIVQPLNGCILVVS